MKLQFLSLTLALLINAATAASALRGSRELSSTDSHVTCRMVIIDTMHETDEVDEDVACVPIVNGIETDDVIDVALPESLESNYAKILEVGLLYVNITHATIINSDIAITSQSEFIVIEAPISRVRQLQDTTWSHGSKTVAFIRVHTTDVSSTVTDDQIKGLFKTDAVNFRTQYNKCSDNKLDFQLANNGIYDVRLNQPMSTYGTQGKPLVDAATEIVKNNEGVSSIASLADKVIFCVAQGPGTWVASAPMYHFR